ncbi:hypothetical protein [Vreelandella neptunia]|uniref:Uncharacterized protein n=1 Tax=Vreelandella neptunia TaxID=115551 RepID=A0ABS9S5T0_9GAMM|nr:hypothetical protein [Halomonas neptunia]MCH4811470.1 hypothetical protein [Halomonas neptunia]
MIFCEGHEDDGSACERKAVHDMLIEAFDEEREVMLCDRCAERLSRERESEEEENDY